MPESKNDKKLLLVIEDNPLLVSMYKSAFEKSGFDVIFAHDGKSGLELAKNNIPPVILLDVLIPSLEGLKVLEELKKDPKTKDIKVLILTILSQDNIRQKAKDLGADDFISKSELKLNEIVEKVVSSFR